MTTIELNELIKKHEDYKTKGVPMDYRDFIELFEELLIRYKYDRKNSK